MLSQVKPINPLLVVIIIVSSVLILLAAITVVLRFLSRRLNSSLRWDDWTAAGSLVFSIGLLILEMIMATIGEAGYPPQELSLSRYEIYLQCFLAYNIIYPTTITLSKLSLVFLYRRIFAVHSFYILTWPVFFLLSTYWVCCFFGELFATDPIEAQWKFWVAHTGIDQLKFAEAMGIWNVINDFIILCLPQLRVWRLHMTNKRKVLLSAVFLLGGFTCVASIVRLAYLSDFNFTSPSHTRIIVVIWTVIEVNMAIICACLPTIPNIFRHYYSSKKWEGRMKSISSSIGRHLVGGTSICEQKSSQEFSELETREGSCGSSSNAADCYSSKDRPSLTGTLEERDRQIQNIGPIAVHKDAAVFETKGSQDDGQMV